MRDYTRYARCLYHDDWFEAGEECPSCLRNKQEQSPRSDVDQPSHYTQGDIECRDAMIAAFGEEQYRIFCKLNAFKYLWRCDYKDTFEKDLDKCIWYARSANGHDPRGA